MNGDNVWTKLNKLLISFPFTFHITKIIITTYSCAGTSSSEEKYWIQILDVVDFFKLWWFLRLSKFANPWLLLISIFTRGISMNDF